MQNIGTTCTEPSMMGIELKGNVQTEPEIPDDGRWDDYTKELSTKYEHEGNLRMKTSMTTNLDELKRTMYGNTSLDEYENLNRVLWGSQLTQMNVE